MKLKTFSVFLSVIFVLLVPVNKILAQEFGAGFVSGNIWYSQKTLQEGDKVKIYTFIFNPDGRKLTGVVNFFDKTTLLGKKDFTVAPQRAEDVFIDWLVTAGDHNIFAKIDSAKYLNEKGEQEKAFISLYETQKDSYSITKKIIRKPSDEKESVENNFFNSFSVPDIQTIITEKTPEYVAKPIVFVADKFEEVRQNIETASELKKDKIKNEIKIIEQNEKRPASKEETSKNPLLKPFKYAENFLFALIVFITGKKVLFYILAFLILFFIARFILNKIF